MNKQELFDVFIKEPKLLIEIVTEIIQHMSNILNDDECKNRQAQLFEISKAIERLETSGIKVPDELRSLKSSLLDITNRYGNTKDEFNYIINGLKELITKRPSNNLPNPEVTNTRKRSYNGKRLLADKNQLASDIIEVLEYAGGSMRVKDAFDMLQIKLGDRLSPDDFETNNSGHVIWENQVHWIRHNLVKLGVFKNNSERGMWELSENYKSIMEELL